MLASAVFADIQVIDRATHMFDLLERLKREVKANAAKAGLLAALFLFGCCFWVPMLTRAITPKRLAAATTSASVASNPVSTGAAVSLVPEDPSQFWSKLEKALANDPMFQSADVRSLSRDPFQSVEVPEPLPVLFAEEPSPKIELKKDPAPTQLALNSTIVGRNRRAAMINGQLYLLGRQIQANGRQYQVTSIESHQVVLSSGEQAVVLTLDRPRLKDVLDGGATIDLPPR